MAQIAVININDLGMAMRFDAQFYQPRYLIDTSKGKWLKIRDVLKKCEYGLSLAMNDEKNGVPMFKMDDISNTFIVSDNVRYAEVSENEYKRFKCKVNDVFFNRVNSEEFVGRTGIFKDSDLDAVFASYLIRLQPRQELVLPQFLNIFLNSKYGQIQIDRYKRRAVNQANVNAQELQEFFLPIPSIEFQQKIADLVDKSWQQLEQSKSLYFQAEQLLLQELGLKDFTPQWVAGYETDYDNVFNVARMDAEYFQPKYEIVKNKIRAVDHNTLENLVKPLKKGIEVGSEAYTDTGIPFLRVSNIEKLRIDNSSEQYIDEELYEELKEKFCPKKGEILLSKDGTPGIAYHLTEDIKTIISGGIVRLKTIEIEPEYLTLVLNSLIVQAQIEQDAGGALIKHWRPDQIKTTLIPILPKAVREKIVAMVRESFSTLHESRQLLEQAKREVEEMIESKAN